MSSLALRATKLWIFLCVEVRRDTQGLVNFFAKYLWIFFLCFIYGFFFRSALWQKKILLEGHAIEFPLFLVSGLAAARIIPFSIQIFDEILSYLKNSKLNEWLLTTPTSPWELFAARMLWNMTRVSTELLALIVFARILINTPLRPFFQWTVLYTMFLLFSATAGIGMILSALCVRLKKGGLLFSLFFQISATFGGVFFPTKLLENKSVLFALVSHSLPITHALDLIRFTLIHEKTTDVAAHAQILVTLTLIFLTVGFVLLQRSLVWARKNGHF